MHPAVPASPALGGLRCFIQRLRAALTQSAATRRDEFPTRNQTTTGAKALFLRDADAALKGRSSTARPSLAPSVQMCHRHFQIFSPFPNLPPPAQVLHHQSKSAIAISKSSTAIPNRPADFQIGIHMSFFGTLVGTFHE